MSGDFLSRWSRRKREARQTPASPAAAAPAPEEPEITPEELAALPKPEEITAETDLAAFFRKGVPELLRNAALRRMWSLDPAIRDFEGPARDYAWDWNVAGGVPGNGPLLPTDDVESMLRQVFGETQSGPARESGESAQDSQAPESVEERPPPRADAAAAQQKEAATLQPPNDSSPPPPDRDNSESQEPVATQQATAAPGAAALRPARHGRARPV